jgi:methylmalonyl-CoA/ethylmalonyl-CoA epimerase
MPPEISVIGQIELTSGDLDRSVEFYRAKLGIPLLLRSENMAFFDCKGIRLALRRAEGTKDCCGPVIYFKVDDIHAAVEALKARGVEFDRDPHLVAKMRDHDLWMALFRDPAGNVLALMAADARP